MRASTLKIGFIDLGIMGAPMAGHLIKAGHPLFVHTCSKGPAAIADGSATHGLSPRGVAERADIVITMLPDTPDVEAVLFADTGVAAGLSPGKVVVDMSSISPIATLSLMAGGPEATFDKIRPLFELMGKNLTRVGGNGDGQTARAWDHSAMVRALERLADFEIGQAAA